MGFISRNLSKKPYDYMCAAFGFVGLFLIIGGPILGLGPWTMMIGLPIYILAFIINLSLHLWEGE